jgi:hypothetical protein
MTPRTMPRRFTSLTGASTCEERVITGPRTLLFIDRGKGNVGKKRGTAISYDAPNHAQIGG